MLDGWESGHYGRLNQYLRSTPMTPFTFESQLYTVAGYPGADWAANARAAGVGGPRRLTDLPR